MLLEKIEIDSCGSLDRTQIGPFKSRLNVVYGPSGSGKSRIVDFLRSVMLGSERRWRHSNTAGTIVWCDQDGLVHCRRETDGTPLGRLAVELVDRDGLTRKYYRGDHEPEVFQYAQRVLTLPRSIIAAIVAPVRETSFRAVVDACQEAGITVQVVHREEAEIARLHEQLVELNRQLDGYRDNLASSDQLELRRRQLIDELAHLDRLDRSPVAHDGRRTRLEMRLKDSQDEQSRLRSQESELRRSLAEVERELATLATRYPQREAGIRIATVRRLQLEDLDTQLTRLCRTLREIKAVRDLRLSNGVAFPGESLLTSCDNGTCLDVDSLLDNSLLINNHPRWVQTRGYYRSRLESARRQLEWLVNHVDGGSPSFADYSDSRRVYDSAYLRRAELDQMISALRGLINELESSDIQVTYADSHRMHLQQCEAALSQSIERLLAAREVLLESIAAEYGVSQEQLSAAFGDWRRCQDAPHLYDWLLGDRVPHSPNESKLNDSRRLILEREQANMLDELSRTANRIDNLSTEIRGLEERLRCLPIALPIVVDHRQRQQVRDELAQVERQIQWLNSRQSLDDERRQLLRRLEGLQKSVRRESPLRARAAYWLDQLCDGRLNHLLPTGSTRFEHDRLQWREMSESERQCVFLALRMAAVDLLRQHGYHAPLLIDDPCNVGMLALDTLRLANVLAKFANVGNQCIVLTGNLGFVEHLRHLGARYHTLSAPKYYELRYRSGDTQLDSSSTINRELDTAWRESQGLYDDPHWYRNDDRYSLDQHRYADEPRYAKDPFPRAARSTDPIEINRVERGPASPFFLTDASPIDLAPSIDAVVAQRLRAVGVETVGQLLHAQPERLARSIDLPDVTPQTLARWQHEANLVCGVPQLRNFDARVLVGCGFTSPRQLAAMHPGQLLEKVEAFLATDRGRQILRSGTSYELSRITSWIAAANRSVARSARHPRRAESFNPPTNPVTRRDAEPRERTARIYRNETERPAHDHQESDRSERRRKRLRRIKRERQQTVVTMAPTESTTLKFYLEKRSPIVDAPSIGPKAAERLIACGYQTVGDFLAADAGTVAGQLKNRRVTEGVVRAWQQQATLVCRVPMLRGHDAQLLVGAGIVEAERLAQADAAWLLKKVEAVAFSSEGKRILRGAKSPDLAEVTDWIQWAKSNRSLRAA